MALLKNTCVHRTAKFFLNNVGASNLDFPGKTLHETKHKLKATPNSQRPVPDPVTYMCLDRQSKKESSQTFRANKT